MTHTFMSFRRLATGIALVAVLPLAAACSGGSSPTSAGMPTAPAATSATPTTPITSTSPTATAAGADAAYCATLKTTWAQLEAMTGNIGDRGALEQGLALLGRVEAAAPVEVKPAWGDFITFIETAASGDTKGMTEAMPKMESAGTKIESHAKTACGIELGS